MKKHFAIILFFSIFLLHTQALSEPLHIVTLQYPPYEYEENGEIKGMATELIREVFRRMNQPIKIELLPWARALTMIELGQADAIYTAYKTSERELFADYSNQVLMPQVVSLFVLKDSPITFDGDFSKIQGYIIGTVLKVSYGEQFDEAVKNKVIDRIRVSYSGEENMQKLMDKQIDILVSNKYGAIYILKKIGKLDSVKELSPAVASPSSYIAFSKKRNLTSIRNQFDERLAEMEKDGTYAKIIVNFFKALE
ncbi:MAG: transporter substrate-binding domain-containing protein [Desulfobacterales bacterium]|nr:transporter substrate-binding domain-containing protein [Desulfobacterales bacterium]